MSPPERNAKEGDMNQITKITATRMTKRDGSFKGFRYDAHFEDGTVQVARACATRLYVNAYQYDAAVCGSQPDKAKLASYFLFGKKQPACAITGGVAYEPIATYPIEVAA